MPKVWNKRDPNTPKDAVYVGRPTKWGNPFVIGKDGTRDQVVNKYREMIMNWHNQLLGAHFHREIKDELKGKDLVCWCAPKPCHADILLEIANS